MPAEREEIRLIDLVDHADSLDRATPLASVQTVFAQRHRRFLGVLANGRFAGVVSGKEIADKLSLAFEQLDHVFELGAILLAQRHQFPMGSQNRARALLPAHRSIGQLLHLSPGTRRRRHDRHNMVETHAAQRCENAIARAKNRHRFTSMLQHPLAGTRDQTEDGAVECRHHGEIEHDFTKIPVRAQVGDDVAIDP